MRCHEAQVLVHCPFLPLARRHYYARRNSTSLCSHALATIGQLELHGSLVGGDPFVPVLGECLNLGLRNLVEDAELQDDHALCRRWFRLGFDGAAGDTLRRTCQLLVMFSHVRE